MKFDYRGEVYDLFDIIDKEEDYFRLEEDGKRGIDIILKNGVIKIGQRFGFQDLGIQGVPVIHDTQNYGTVFFVNYALARKGSEPIDERKFYGTGEVNRLNFTSQTVPFPISVAEKRARSRAILQEIGVKAYGEEEAEAFQKAIWAAKKGGKFTSKSSAQPTPTDPTPVKQSTPAKPAAKSATNEEDIKVRLQKVTAELEKTGITDRTQKIKFLRYCLNVEKGVPRFDDFVQNPSALDKAEALIKSGDIGKILNA